MALIDLTDEHAPIVVERRVQGGLAIRQGNNLVLLDDAELTELIRIACPPVTPAKRYRMA
jgi:hypothetical protein